ncbi:MAG: PfkB family carbohydrate kinase [Dichotomicrobium sp.]
MPTVLSISSQVVHGHVGNSASVFPLRRLGVHVLPVPTILLSSHPAIPVHAIQRIAPDKLDEMVGALAANGWLDGLDAVQTGYLPSAAHVAVAAKWARRLKADGALYVCDPIIGDEPAGLYVPEESARAIADELLPLTDVATPNRFELGWFAGAEIADLAGALAAARALPAECVLATSCPADGKLVNLLVARAKAWRTEVGAHERVIPGAGDFFAALWLGHVLRGESRVTALALATAGTEAAIAASGGEGIDIVGTQALWTAPQPWPVVGL